MKGIPPFVKTSRGLFEHFNYYRLLLTCSVLDAPERKYDVTIPNLAASKQPHFILRACVHASTILFSFYLITFVWSPCLFRNRAWFLIHACTDCNPVYRNSRKVLHYKCTIPISMLHLARPRIEPLLLCWQTA